MPLLATGTREIVGSDEVWSTEGVVFMGVDHGPGEIDGTDEELHVDELSEWDQGAMTLVGAHGLIIHVQG